MALSIFVLNIFWITQLQYKISMQDKILKIKIFDAIQKSITSVKYSSLKIFSLYCIVKPYPNEEVTCPALA